MTALTSRIAYTVLLGLTAAAFAAPVADARMTPQQCYKRDSNCTQFCDSAKPDWRHECFMRCNKYLDNCLSTGVWTDQGAMADPGSDPATPPKGPKGVLTLPTSGGLLDAGPGLPTQGPAGTGMPAGGGATTTGPTLR